jgi:hypothetical protein
VDSGEQALCYILVLWQPINIRVCEGLGILQYSGDYAIILYGDSCKCININMVSGIIYNYHMDKLVAGNNLLVTYLCQDNVFTFHSVEIGEYP